MRPAYFRTLFPVSRYVLPADSLNVKAPDEPGSSLTQPYELHRTAGSGRGGWWRLSRSPARKNEAGREDDGGCSQHVFLLGRVPRHCTCNNVTMASIALYILLASSGAQPGW